MLILGIETSCDDTAAAVLELGSREENPGFTSVGILADLVQSQSELHTPYGGVVPELASRRHLENIYPVVESTLARAAIQLQDLDLIAATQGPGLVGSLLVGFNFAKALSMAGNIPLVGVDHIAAHLASPFLAPVTPEFPYLALTVSGGHTSLFLVESPTSYTLLGRTRDDAAGEAFDKVAKLLGLGYPGGPKVSELAEKGDPKAFTFPRARLEADSLDFSFSGLKTAVANAIRREGERPAAEADSFAADICASFQEAVVEVLVEKSINAARRHGCKQLVLSGGVAANPRLRRELSALADREGDYRIFMPAPHLCTDNGAMVAMAGFFHRRRAGRHLSDDVYSRFGGANPPSSPLPAPSGKSLLRG